MKRDPLWYKDAVFYELRVRSFQDSNADGIGDLPGLTSRLGYLQDLGVTVLWLLPICVSPGRDDGYDASDYVEIDPEIGTLDDFRRFLDEAHRRGIRVVTELVLNHTSDQHAWFQRARRAPKGSPERDFYVWSDSPDRYQGARIIFKDFEPSNWAWDPIAQQYFWHRFYAHQPDLNFESPAVLEEMLGVVDFWLKLGVDGLRLDAVPYLFEEEGTSCENLPATHGFLRKLRAHVDARFQDRMLLAEANQWPEDAAAYFGKGDECHMNFHFPIMPRIFMAIHQEDRFPLVDILAQTPEPPEPCQWALFLRNHDELTLEMVTDEERDYMYRAFANDPTARINLGIRRRLAPLVGNNRRNMELMNALLFSLPGTPVLYYGDEIGMGDNIYLGDRNGVRTPMQWSADRNAGFSRANPQRLILPIIIDPEYHYESVNVEGQQNNPHSLLWWTKRLIALRKRYQAFGRGTLTLLHPDNPRVLAFVRRHGDERILVVANLSRHVQYVELDLAEHRGMVPVELFGRTTFPPVGELPYLLTLSGHGFYWFSLERRKHTDQEARLEAYQPPMLELPAPWERLLGEDQALFTAILPAWLRSRGWFAGRQRGPATVSLLGTPRLSEAGGPARVAILHVEYAEGEPERYALPLTVLTGPAAAELQRRSPHAVIAEIWLRTTQGEPITGVLADALADAPSGALLLAPFRGTSPTVGRAELQATRLAPLPVEELEPKLLRHDHAAAVATFGDQLFFRFSRRPCDGVSPEVELGGLLAGKEGLPLVPLLGHVEWRPVRGEPVTLATLHRYVQTEGDAWRLFRAEVRRFLERSLARATENAPLPPGRKLLGLAQPPPQLAQDLVGGFLDKAALLGRRTAELHRALAALKDPACVPEPYSPGDQRSAYQSMRNITGLVLRQLRSRLGQLPAPMIPRVQALLAQERGLYATFEPLLHRRLTAIRTRVHGKMQLGKILHTGKDFLFTELDGPPDQPLSQRRRRRSPLRDVARLVRSIHGAAAGTLLDEAVVRPADRVAAEPWALAWWGWVTGAYLRAYLENATGLLPATTDELSLLLDCFVLQEALEEVGAEVGRGEPRLLAPLLGIESRITAI